VRALVFVRVQGEPQLDADLFGERTQLREPVGYEIHRIEAVDHDEAAAAEAELRAFYDKWYGYGTF